MALPALRSTFHVSRWQLFHLYFCFVVFVLAVTQVLPAFDFGLFLAIELNLLILPEWLAFLASLLAVRGRPQLAMQLINSGLRIDDQNYRLLCARALAYQQIGDLESALEDASQAILVAPNRTYALTMRGVVHLCLSDYVEAEADYNQLLKKNPRDLVAALNRACARLQLGKINECIADCDLVLQGRKYRENANFIKIAALLEMRKIKEAEVLVQQLEASKSKHHLVALARAMLHGASHKYEDVLAICATAPADRKAEFFLTPQAGAYLSLNEGDLALSTASLVVTKNPQIYTGYYYRALVLIEAGYWQEAVADCNMVDTLQPHLSLSNALRARLCFAAGDMEQCLENCDKALLKNQFDSHALHYKVKALCALSRFDEAREAAKLALEINPVDPEALGAMALVLLKLEGPEAALPLLDRAIAENPHMRFDYKLRSEVHAALGDSVRSNSDLERYQSMQTQLLAGLNESVLRLQESRELLLEG
jgi:tetratricopeptide (TPR) repeat protein